jgi:pimeloyl-ACP methyl ester carboxylesterase
MAEQKITRHFATIHNGRWGTRQVHYRQVGKGPVVLCLHQSPLSSRDMLATMERWKGQFTCIAPDTPGFGLSTPLGVERAEVDDFADAVVEFMDALGIDKAAAYGFHTGAMITGGLAAKYPARITCGVANGYVILTEQERADLVANYLPPFAPSWDGAHLTWLWSRMREQTIFFPWYAKTQADRLEFNVPPPAALQAGLVDFLRAGDHYRVGYRAAFTMRSDVALQQMRVPMLVTAADYDPLSLQLARIRNPAKSVTVKAGGTGEQTLDLCAAFLRKHNKARARKLPATAPIAGRLWSEYVDVPGGQLRVQRNTDAAGRTVVVMHDAAGSSDIVAPIARGFIGHRPVVAIDLPGHGESDALLQGDRVSVEDYAQHVLAALKSLGIKEFDFVGTWGGGMVGLELALTAPKQLKHLVMADMLYFDAALLTDLRANYTPDIQPNWYGGHLLEAWHLMRDQGLFWPWYDRTTRGIIRQPLYVDPAMVHSRVLELFRSEGMWRKAYQAHFNYPLKAKLKQCKLPMQFVAPAWDPQLGVTQQAGRDFPRAGFLKMPDDMSRWAEALLPFCES